MVTPRRTVSNPILATKNAQPIVPLKKKTQKKTQKAKEPEPLLEDSESGGAVGGMKEEDDTLEKEASVSSPMKGTDSRGAALVSLSFPSVQKPDGSLFQSLVTLKEEKGAKRKAARYADLPAGANDGDAWRLIVIPNFINFNLGSEIPWADERTIESTLNLVCKHAYGDRVKIDVRRGSVAHELVSEFQFPLLS